MLYFRDKCQVGAGRIKASDDGRIDESSACIIFTLRLLRLSEWVSYQESRSSKRTNIGSETPEYNATSVPTNPHKRTPNAAFAYQVSLRADVELIVRLLRLTHQRFCQGSCSVTSNHSFDTIALNRILNTKAVFRRA